MELKVGGYVLNDAGVMLSGYDGQREAYDLAPLVGVRFEERARAAQLWWELIVGDGNGYWSTRSYK